ncbi:hypothetical protein [Thermus tenuipuniceus]|uniref:hypothetical protein n=1 Tax=Thermus tenuipuniceus TaxID=2078690 RepID=UPI0013E40575|nr:hypothetical protein [Thermus tenuipuniceus]
MSDWGLGHPWAFLLGNAWETWAGERVEGAVTPPYCTGGRRPGPTGEWGRG